MPSQLFCCRIPRHVPQTRSSLRTKIGLAELIFVFFFFVDLFDNVGTWRRLRRAASADGKLPAPAGVALGRLGTISGAHWDVHGTS